MLAAAYLVKNELDILETNLRFHHAMGVEAFAIMDNGSTDGTRELLDELSKEMPIHIVDKTEHTYQFHKWRKEIVSACRKAFNPDRVICNDADEFWLPRDDGQSLKNLLNRKEAIITVNRFNMLPTPAMEDGSFLNTDLKVSCPIVFSSETQIEKDSIAMLLSTIGPKVALNPHGLLKLNGGNHRAKHLRFWSKTTVDDIRVIHFPVRSYAQFEKNVANRTEVIRRKDIKTIRIGDHYRRWADMLEAGRLREEYHNFLFSSEELETLEKIGVVERDSRPSAFIQKIVSESQSS
ncbi:Uncharacterised protein [BD1-7 clade bacterium]|uniref:Glycosyltransferase 2-like domain-containing protein n=1 Tax=BD1-7 clade bacterium TaxID=2029982 RepID=A0A5S9QZX1_9GAMM|nr:Uncharacterised protein [BD1-7 clade bacterium]